MNKPITIMSLMMALLILVAGCEKKYPMAQAPEVETPEVETNKVPTEVPEAKVEAQVEEETPKPESLEKPELEKNSVPVEEPFILNKFSASVLPGPVACDYAVRLVWVSNQKPVAWTINRSIDGSTQKHLVTLNPDTTQYIDDDIKCGENYRYFLGAISSEELRELKDVALSIPLDLLIDKVETLSQIKDYNRLFLSPSGRILSNGEKLEIHVNEIISDNGVIESFAEGTTAPTGVAGRHGGSLVIHAKKGRGELFIFARGENGGKGLRGREGAQGPSGARGNDGVCGNRQAEGGLAENEEKLCRPEVYQQAADRVQSYQKADYFEKQRMGNIQAWSLLLGGYYCKVATGKGGMGGAGLQGERGGAGFDGGDTPSVLVYIEEPSSLNIIPKSLPGMPGLGGEGGPGGAGGVGGEAGSPDAIPICGPATAGPEGPTGPQGTQGPNGEAGKSSPLCIKAGPVTYGDCDEMKDFLAEGA